MAEPMERKELAETLDAIRWTQSQLADALGCKPSTVWQMLTEPPRRRVPDKVATWLRNMRRWHETHPAPEWRTRMDLAPR